MAKSKSKTYSDLVNETIADASIILEQAEKRAKDKLIEDFAPQYKRILAKEEEDSEDEIDIEELPADETEATPTEFDVLDQDEEDSVAEGEEPDEETVIEPDGSEGSESSEIPIATATDEEGEEEEEIDIESLMKELEMGDEEDENESPEGLEFDSENSPSDEVPAEEDEEIDLESLFKEEDFEDDEEMTDGEEEEEEEMFENLESEDDGHSTSPKDEEDGYSESPKNLGKGGDAYNESKIIIRHLKGKNKTLREENTKLFNALKKINKEFRKMIIVNEQLSAVQEVFNTRSLTKKQKRFVVERLGKMQAPSQIKFMKETLLQLLDETVAISKKVSTSDDKTSVRKTKTLEETLKSNKSLETDENDVQPVFILSENRMKNWKKLAGIRS